MSVVSQNATPAFPGRRWNARLYPGFLPTIARFRLDLRQDLAQLAGVSTELTDNVVLCASEAFANAVQHTSSGHEHGVVMRILSTPVVTDRETTLRLSVIDDGDSSAHPTIPTQRTVEEWEQAEDGRGLLILHHLASEWGTNRVHGHPHREPLNHVTWAEFHYPTLNRT